MAWFDFNCFYLKRIFPTASPHWGGKPACGQLLQKAVHGQSMPHDEIVFAS
jgi:hypothetical protein